MKATDIPSKFPIPFANAGAKNTIPQASQIGVTPGAASLTDGFPPLTRTKVAAGGVPPSGLDFNGILYELSAGLQWSGGGGMYTYDSTFSTAIGGYPKGSVLLMASGDGLWISNADDNTADPDAGVSANWTPIMPERVTNVTGNTTLTISDAGLILVDATAGNVTITLEAANALKALGFTFIRTDTTTNTVTIQRAGSDTIDGGTSLGLVSRSPVSLISDGVSEYYSNVPAITSSSIQPIDASVASNALTITLNPTVLDFRDSTLGSGTVNKRVVDSAISLTISSGSTLGLVSGQLGRIAVLAIDNSGVIELAAVNLAGGVNLDETTLISTTAEGGAGGADSASTIYSTTARSNLPYRVVGFIDLTEATAGQWASAPSRIQGAGGQALDVVFGFGHGQGIADVTASRAFSATYYNVTGKPKWIAVSANSSAGGAAVTLTINGVNIRGTGVVNYVVTAYGMVPPGGSYSATAGTALYRWIEF